MVPSIDSANRRQKMGTNTAQATTTDALRSSESRGASSSCSHTASPVIQHSSPQNSERAPWRRGEAVTSGIAWAGFCFTQDRCTTLCRARSSPVALSVPLARPVCTPIRTHPSPGSRGETVLEVHEGMYRCSPVDGPLRKNGRDGSTYWRKRRSVERMWRLAAKRWPCFRRRWAHKRSAQDAQRGGRVRSDHPPPETAERATAWTCTCPPHLKKA